MNKNKLIASGLIVANTLPYVSMTTFARIDKSNENISNEELDTTDVELLDKKTTEVKILVSIPYDYSIVIPKDDIEFNKHIESLIDSYLDITPLDEENIDYEHIMNVIVEKMIGTALQYEKSLSNEDPKLLNTLIDNYEDYGKLNSKEFTQLKDIIERLKKNILSDENYDKVVVDKGLELEDNIWNILTDKINDDEIDRNIREIIDYIEDNYDDLSDENKKLFDEIKKSYEENGKLNDKEIAQIIGVIDDILKDHMKEEDYIKHIKDEIQMEIDNDDVISPEAKKEIIDDIIDKLKEVEDSLDYQDKEVIKDIENTLEIGELPSKEDIKNLLDKVENEISKDDKDYNEILSKDIIKAEDEIIKIITGETTDKKEIEKNIENAFNIIESNRDNLTKEEQELFDKLKDTYDKNGTLTDNELSDIIDLLEKVLQDHMKSEDYVDHLKDLIDKITENFDKIPSDVIKDIVEDIIDDFKDYEDKLPPYQKEILDKIKDLIEEDKSITKDDLGSLRDIVETVEKPVKEETKELVKDTIEIEDDIIKIITGEINDKDKISEITEDALNIIISNKDRLTKEEQEILDKLIESYNKNGILTNKELSELINLLEKVLQDNMLDKEYVDHLNDLLDKIIKDFDKIPNDVIKDLVNDILDNFNGYEKELTPYQKEQFDKIKELINKGEPITKEILNSLKDVINTINHPIPDPIKETIDKVQTGDVTPIALLATVSLGAFAGMYYFGRKKK